MIGIYKITNPKGKVYIGQSSKIEKRFKSYKKMNKSNSSQVRLHRSFLKYGIENHSFDILIECEIEELNNKERYYQDLFECIGKKGLNCVLVSTKEIKSVVSSETRLKQSISARNKVLTEEHKANISKSNTKSMLGKKHSKESLILMSLNRKGTSSRLGATLSDETKLKISLKAKGRKASEETKLKMSITRKAIALKNKLNK